MSDIRPAAALAFKLMDLATHIEHLGLRLKAYRLTRQQADTLYDAFPRLSCDGRFNGYRVVVKPETADADVGAPL